MKSSWCPHPKLDKPKWYFRTPFNQTYAKQEYKDLCLVVDLAASGHRPLHMSLGVGKQTFAPIILVGPRPRSC